MTAISSLLHMNVIHLDERWKIIMPDINALLRRVCRRAFANVVLECDEKCELAVVLANDATVQDLNHTYRGKNKPTNVLSFPADNDPGLALEGGMRMLGDVVLSLDTIEKEAVEQEKTFLHHLTHLVVHGFLHVLGYDHEREKDARLMEALEVHILHGLGISNPYEAR